MAPADPSPGSPPADLAAVLGFLAGTQPFDSLPADVLDALSRSLSVVSVEAEDVVLKPHQPVNNLYLVRSGRIALCSPGGAVWAERVSGQTFGLRALLSDGFAMFRAIAVEESRLYLIPVVSRKWLEFEGGVISGLFWTQGRRWSAGRRSRHEDA